MTTTVATSTERLPQLDIEIGPPQDGVHPVRLARTDAVVTTTFVSPMRKEELTDANDLLDRGLVARMAAKALGSKLFEALFHDDNALRTLSETTGGKGARFRFVLADGAAAAIPWELLFDEAKAEYLAQQGAVSRWILNPVAVPTPPRPTFVEGPLRALVVLANPVADDLDLDAEADSIVSTFEPAVREGIAEQPVVLRSATRVQLQDAVREAAEAGTPFHIIHFAGHTGRSPGDPQPHLLLHGEDGEVTPEAFARIVADSDARLVFLNACGSLQSGASLTGQVLPGFAGELTQRGVPAVVGMQVPVIDDFATRIAGNFYGALLDGRPVDVALTDVRRLIEKGGSDEFSNFGIPVCYLASGTGAMVPPPRERRTLWERYRKRIGFLVAVLIPLIFTYVAIVSQYAPFLCFWCSEPPPEVMDGDFNIAVAELAVLDPETSEAKNQAASLPGSLTQRLADVLSCGTTTGEGGGLLYECRGPEETGRFEGNNQKRADEAGEYAQEANSHLVFYGTVGQDGSKMTFAPEIYISGGDLVQAEELLGPHQLEPVESEGPPLTVRQSLREKAVDLGRDLGDLAQALNLYATADYAAALSIVNEILAQDSFTIDASLLHLVAGNLEGKLGMIEEAETSYEAAIAATPGYARGWLGLGEVAYQKGRDIDQDCRPGTVDPDLLAESSDHYETAITEPVSPPAASIDSKASFGIARNLTCLSVAGEGDHWAEARGLFQGVVDDHLGGTSGLKELASESYGFLALIEVQTDGDDPAALERAIVLWESALDETRDPTREGTFNYLIADALLRLDRPGEACNPFKLALRAENPAALADDRFGCD